MKNWSEELYLSCHLDDIKRYSECIKYYREGNVFLKEHIRNCFVQSIIYYKSGKVFNRMLIDFSDKIDKKYDYFRCALNEKNFEVCKYFIDNGFVYNLDIRWADGDLVKRLRRYIKVKAV